MIDYTKILNSKYAGFEWTLDGDDYSGLTWLSDTSKPTKKQLDDLWQEVQDELAAEINNKKLIKASVLERLGLTEEEIKALLS
jgi:hypothetical protein